MKVSAYCLLLGAIAACGGSGSPDKAEPLGNPDHNPQSGTSRTNAEIAALVYDNSYSVPADFFVDDRADTTASYTIHHVLDASKSYELCTDDYSEALTWEEADNASRSVQGYFVESYENERYFEFVRELSYDNDVGNVGASTSPGYARVFKCSNTDRSGVDRTLLTGYSGTLNTRPLEAESVRVFSEYLWQFSFFPASRKKVLDSVASQTADELRHTLKLALSTTRGAGNCDLIEVAEWHFTANRATGEVQRQFELLRSFEAALDAGIPVLCD